MALRKINVNDAVRVADLLAGVQSRCRERCIGAARVASLSHEAETRLARAGIPQAMRAGAAAVITPERLPNSYKYRAEGTHVLLERGKRDWFVLKAWRGVAGSCAGGGPQRLVVTVSDRPRLLESMLRSFGITLAKGE